MELLIGLIVPFLEEEVVPMPQPSLKALLVAYRNQAEWLLDQSVQFESGARKVTGLMRGKEIDLTPNMAAEYRHRSRNLMAIIEIYERLHPEASSHQNA